MPLVKGGLTGLSRTLPAVQLGPGGAEAYSAWGRSLLGYSQYFGEQADREAVELAKKEGEKVAVESGLSVIPSKFRDNTTLSGAAFNDALKAGYGTRLRTSVQNKAVELETKYPLDPDRQQAEFQVWHKGMIEKMPNEFRPWFEQTVTSAMQSNVTSALAKQLAVEKTSNEAYLSAALESDAAMSYQLGRQTAPGIDNTTTAQWIRMLVDRGASVSSLVANSTVMTQSQGIAFLQEHGSFTTRQFLTGMYDAADDKDDFLFDLESGALTLPVSNAEGKVIEKPLLELMTAEDRIGFQTYVSTEYNRARAREMDVIADENRNAERTLDRLHRQLRTTADQDRRQGIYYEIIHHPLADDSDVDRASEAISGGFSDPFYVSDAMLQARAGLLTSSDMIDTRRASAADIERIDKVIDAWADEDHFSKNPRFQEADKILSLQLGSLVDTVAGDVGLASSDAARWRNSATNVLRAQFRLAVDEVLADRGVIMRANKAGFIPAKDPVSGEPFQRTIIDPIAWVKEKIAAIDERILPIRDRLKELSKSVTEARLNSMTDDEEQASYWADQYSLLAGEESELRQSLETVMTGVIEQVARE